ncbi:hypothetical protein J6590_031636 [Homalodisca vitripennis]|nr:hypothetical protein J6590_031636 [Homalodisca vitripennis]
MEVDVPTDDIDFTAIDISDLIDFQLLYDNGNNNQSYGSETEQGDNNVRAIDQSAGPPAAPLKGWPQRGRGRGQELGRSINRQPVIRGKIKEG